MNDLEAIRQRIDCRRLYHDHGGRIRGRITGDGWVKAHCFKPGSHNNGDRNPSLTIGPLGFRCYGCGVSGDCFGLVQGVRGTGFAEAKRYCAARCGLAREVLPDGYPARRIAPTIKHASAMPWRPSPARLDLNRQLWAVLSTAPPTKRMAGLCTSRGLSVETAYAHGLRDIAPVWLDFVDVLHGASTSTLIDAGLRRIKNGVHQDWWPITRDGWAAGLLIPIWHPQFPGVPVSWRVRLYRPTKKFKAMGTFAAPGIPLGFGLPSPMTCSFVGAPHPVVFITDGEPDWLSVQECLGRRASAIGITTSGSGWKSEWTPLLDQTTCIVLMVHDSHALKIRDDLVASLEQQRSHQSGYRLLWRVVSEKDDCNDLHRRGLLQAMVDEALGAVVMG